ncbi:MAG: hypothetical protein AB7V56_07230 [Candidatus Nitrosocosmicus sp.]
MFIILYPFPYSMEAIIGDIPEWTEEDTQIIQEYEDDVAKGNISDFVIIPRDIK